PGSAGRGVPGLGAPAFALTETLPLTPTAGITGTAPITATAPATATVPGPRVAQPVQAQKILTTVHAMEVISTTGQKTVPDHAAIGTLRLANTSQAAVTLPANLPLRSPSG